MGIQVHQGDSRELLKALADSSVDSVVTDPPYALVSITKRWGPGATPPAKEGVYKRATAGFMGKAWDTGETAFDPAFWQEVLRVLKPGGHLIAFGGTRTYHRLACAIEDGGFEIRDQLAWLFGSGFPKSHSVAKGIDATLLAGSARTEDMRKMSMGESYTPSGRGRVNFDHGSGSAMNGSPAWEAKTDDAREWQGWGTALKPAQEPICLARKPLIGTVAANVLEHGVGALNIDASRIEASDNVRFERAPGNVSRENWRKGTCVGGAIPTDQGRWPANVIHDGSPEVLACFPDAGGQQGPISTTAPSSKTSLVYGAMKREGEPSADRRYTDHGATNFAPLPGARRGDDGLAARFFYTPKADKLDRLESKHPTVKPVDLMAYLIKLVTPKGGVVLDPFAGSGSTGMAAMREGFDCILMEREAEYVADINRRLAHVHGDDLPLFDAPPRATQADMFGDDAA